MLLTYGCLNVNGLGSSLNNDSKFIKMLRSTNFDIYFLQETRINFSESLTNAIRELGYDLFLNPGNAPGRKGVGILIRPEHKQHAFFYSYANPADITGRVSVLRLYDSYFFNLYLPFTRGYGDFWEIKMEIIKKVLNEITILKKNNKNVFVCGDFNLIGKKTTKTLVDYTGFFIDDFVNDISITINTTPEFDRFISGLVHDNTFAYAKEHWNCILDEKKLKLQNTFNTNNIYSTLKDIDAIQTLCKIYQTPADYKICGVSSNLVPEASSIKNFQYKNNFIQTSVLETFNGVLHKIKLQGDTKEGRRVDHVFASMPTTAFIDDTLKLSDHPFIYGMVRTE